MAETQSLAPAWLSFNRELPASSQEKVVKPPTEREKLKRYGKHSPHHHLAHTAPAHPSAMSSNWRNSDLSPRVLNRSMSSPVFDALKDKPEAPKSPDRSTSHNSVQSSPSHGSMQASPERGYAMRSPKLLKRPPLMSSRSQPNLLTKEIMAGWQKPIPARSPPPSRSSSFSSISSPLAQPTVSAPASQAAPQADDVKPDTEIDRLRALVPAAAVAPLPKPPSRLATPRKNAHPKPQEKPKKPLPLAAQLKKASSEPLLFAPGSPEDVARRAKAHKVEKVKLKETVEDKDKAATTRSNFFMDVIKLEKSLQYLSEDDSEVVVGDVAPGTDLIDEKTEAISEDATDHPDGSRLSPIDQDDEERFLRALGWVPEEEDHVPALDEKEIADVRLRLKQTSTPGSPLRHSYPSSAQQETLQSA